jgi:hypothetical protein
MVSRSERPASLPRPTGVTLPGARYWSPVGLVTGVTTRAPSVLPTIPVVYR